METEIARFQNGSSSKRLDDMELEESPSLPTFTPTNQVRSSLLGNLDWEEQDALSADDINPQSNGPGTFGGNGFMSSPSFGPRGSFKSSSMFLQQVTECNTASDIAQDTSYTTENISTSKVELFSGFSLHSSLLEPLEDDVDVINKSSTLSMGERNTNEHNLVGYTALPSEYSATLSNGKSFCLSKRKTHSFNEMSGEALESSGSRNHYGVPIHDLLYEVKKHAVKQRPQSAPSRAPTTKKRKYDGDLLSEKYRPKKWVDLLGPEKTHRFMLRWLVSWSKVVFDEQQLAQPSEIYNFDSLGRPAKKILLLHGPPGIGKTTVAHLMAKQSGYDVMEINASDERAAVVVKDKIYNAVGSHRIGSAKPVCIVADEIEGASENGFIKALVDMLVADEKALVAKFTNSEKKSSKRKPKLLLRPIIAVCNDVYAPSLRALRPHVEIVHYKRSPSSALLAKLKEICQVERIVADTKKLSKIVDTSDGDIRSCLNTLQFGFREEDNSSKKDINQNWVRLTNRIFRRLSNEGSFKSLLEDLDSSGEHERVINGCFSLYPHVNFTDDMVRKPGYIGDWMHFYEQINARIYNSQHSQLADYLSAVAMSYHVLFSAPSNVKEQRISSDYEVYEKQRALLALCHDVWSVSSTHVRQLFNTTAVAIELIPYILHIVNAEFCSSSALRPNEIRRVANVASLMLDMNINFAKDKLEGGSIIYRLDPPLENVAILDEQMRQKHTTGKYCMRQLIAQAMQNERGLRTKRILEETNSNSTAGRPDRKKVKVDLVKKKKTNFFIAGTRSESGQNGEISPSQLVQIEERIWVQFVEGFSNAVRKDLTWVDLINPQ